MSAHKWKLTQILKIILYSEILSFYIFGCWMVFLWWYDSAHKWRFLKALYLANLKVCNLCLFLRLDTALQVHELQTWALPLYHARLTPGESWQGKRWSAEWGPGEKTRTVSFQFSAVPGRHRGWDLVFPSALGSPACPRVGQSDCRRWAPYQSVKITSSWIPTMCSSHSSFFIPFNNDLVKITLPLFYRWGDKSWV